MHAHGKTVCCEVRNELKPTETRTVKTGAKPKSTRIIGRACSGDDCKSVATCPTGYSVTKCESAPQNSGDGIHLDKTSCYARGHSRSRITAIATCSQETVTSVAVSNSMYLDNQDV